MSENEQVRAFAFVVDGEVIGTIHIPSNAPNADRLWAGLSSDPEVVECTEIPEVSYGWNYDGASFLNPGE
jgi:hypothetical protein